MLHRPCFQKTVNAMLFFTGKRANKTEPSRKGNQKETSLTLGGSTTLRQTHIASKPTQIHVPTRGKSNCVSGHLCHEAKFDHLLELRVLDELPTNCPQAKTMFSHCWVQPPLLSYKRVIDRSLQLTIGPLIH